MEITFLGHATFLVDTGDHTLIIDPFLTGNPKAEVTATDIKCDYVLVTHGHGDHFTDVISIAKQNDATVVGNYEIATYCGKQGVNAHPLHIGGCWSFPFGKLKFTIAHHSSGLDTDDGIVYLGNPVGILLFAEGKTIYYAGDTGLFLDMKLIGEMHPIDVAILPIGDNFTMGVDDAAKAVEFLNPKVVIPMHYNTFELIEVDDQDFKEKASKSGAEVNIMAVGDCYSI